MICFLQIFASRLVGGGLYRLDEPEVPLSPLRQLALLLGAPVTWRRGPARRVVVGAGLSGYN